MGSMSQDRVAHVIEMWHLRFIKQDAVFELARVPHHHPVPDDHVFAHVTSAPDVTVLPDPRRPFQHRALLDDRPGSDENRIADKWLPDQLSEHRRFQTKLQIARDLTERVPDIFLRLKQLWMRGVFETEKFRRRKHWSYAPPRRVIFCPSFVSRASQPRAASTSRNSSLFLQSFASLACTRASASSAISAGNSASSPLICRTPSTPFHHSSHDFASSAPISPASILRFVSRIVSNKTPSAPEIFRSSSSAWRNPDSAFGAWCFSGAWSLELGALDLFVSLASARSLSTQSSILPSACRASSIPSQVKFSGAR